jgi:hypothetical protein
MTASSNWYDAAENRRVSTLPTRQALFTKRPAEKKSTKKEGEEKTDNRKRAIKTGPKMLSK